MRLPCSTPTSRRHAVALLLLALLVLAAHTLGLVHRTLHGPAGHAAPLAAVHVHDEAHGEAGGWLASLFDGHDDESKCRLFDSLMQGAPGTAETAAVLAPTAAGLLATLAGAVLARWAALFDARGPPAVR